MCDIYAAERLTILYCYTICSCSRCRCKAENIDNLNNIIKRNQSLLSYLNLHVGMMLPKIPTEHYSNIPGQCQNQDMFQDISLFHQILLYFHTKPHCQINNLKIYMLNCNFKTITTKNDKQHCLTPFIHRK